MCTNKILLYHTQLFFYLSINKSYYILFDPIVIDLLI